ncbi:MAG: branched-chain amino acid ABC transporter permease [Actinomycetota bacterium]
MAVAVEDATVGAVPAAGKFRPSRLGIGGRALVAAFIVALVLLAPLVLDSTWDRRISLAAIYGIIGLSVNIITGHAGQISLGHQAFVGIGAFISSYIVTQAGLGFFFALPLAGVMGGALALVLGLVALRIRGLYLALITLAFGLMAETTVFNWRDFTGGGAGAAAPRPSAFQSEQAYAYLCFILLALFLYVDWRLVKSKAGRAIVSLRNDERVAATLGVNVTAYKLLAFVTSGMLAGVAGALFAHRNEFVQALDFQLQTALVWILMAVVGGLGSRAGVVMGSAFFAIFPFLLPATSFRVPILGDVIVQILTPLIGALLLILTLTLYQGGIGQQLLPLRRWLAGGRFYVRERHVTLTDETGEESPKSSSGEKA